MGRVTQLKPSPPQLQTTLEYVGSSSHQTYEEEEILPFISYVSMLHNQQL